MKKMHLLFLWLCYASIVSIAQEKSTSPYFQVTDVKAQNNFPLLHTSAEVDIAGIIAQVTVKQIYTNHGDTPIEAKYIFPASTNAAVHALSMQIGTRRIEAKIEEKSKARQQYKQAKQAGKRASLLEQERPNVFQMQVANIMPADTIVLELVYTELLVPENGLYEFVYPTVVGPRYTGESSQDLVAATKWTANPYLKKGKKVPYTFDIDICLNTSIPIQQVQSISHAIDVTYKNKANALIQLASAASGQGNKDFILQYQLKGKAIESGLLCYEGEKENFFLMMMQPPKRPKVSELPKREYIFIMDVSGSMHGYPLDVSKRLLTNLVGNLGEKDKFNVLLFAGGSTTLAPQSIAANTQNLRKAISLIENQSGGGGTNLLAAIKEVMAIPKQKGYARTFVIATDGYINVEPDVFHYIENHLHKANFFSFGIGTSVNRHLIEGMARIGKGSPFIITDETEAATKAEKFRQYIQSPILTDIQFAFEGIETYDLSTTHLPDLFAERPLVLMGKYKKGTRGSIHIKGTTGKGKFKKIIPFTEKSTTNNHAALRQLWARQKIKNIGDYANLDYTANPALKTEITQLGLAYNLLTDYTSFIAIENTVANPTKQYKSIQQPLPLPDKVENHAIGNWKPTAFGVEFSNSSLELEEDFEVEPPRTAEPPAPPPFPTIPEEAIEEGEEPVFEDQVLEVEAERPPPPPTRFTAPPPPPPLPEPEVEEVFKVIESMPQFSGCENSANSNCSSEKMLTFIDQHLVYPKIAKENSIEGTVVIQVIIDKFGRIESAKIVRDIGGGCGAAALRVVLKMPNFIAGKQRGKPVRTQVNIPVRFKLG